MHLDIGQTVYFHAPWHESKDEWEPVTVCSVHEHYIYARNSVNHVNRYTYNVIEVKK